MGAPNPVESPEVEGVLNASQGSLVEVNPENESCTPETETGMIKVHAEMASEVLGTLGDTTALESQGISGADEVTDTMQIPEAEGIEKVQDMDDVMQIDESLTIPELEQVLWQVHNSNECLFAFFYYQNNGKLHVQLFYSNTKTQKF